MWSNFVCTYVSPIFSCRITYVNKDDFLYLRAYVHTYYGCTYLQLCALMHVHNSYVCMYVLCICNLHIITYMHIQYRGLCTHLSTARSKSLMSNELQVLKLKYVR